jgi:hypothetical protein
MQANERILKLWGIFLILGIVLFILQIYHTTTQLKKNYNGNT